MSTQTAPFEATPVHTFALVPARVPLGPPLMTGLLAGFAVVLVAGMQGPGPLAAGLGTALFVATLSMRRLRQTLPDRVRLAGASLELARGDQVVKRVSLGHLAEVNQLATPSGPLLYLADPRQTVMLARAQLAEQRRWDELSQTILEAIAEADPTGTTARQAVQTGRLRDEIAQQPVRGVPVLMGILGLASLLGFGALQALVGRPFPREELGALSAPLFQAGEHWRLLSYPFQQASGLQLMLVMVGLLWLGGWLEKLLGWERVVVAFTVGSAAAAGAWLLLDAPTSLVGGFPGIFGLFGAMGAVTLVGRGSLPRALLPRRGFWVMTLIYVLIYLLVLPVVLSEALQVDPVGRLTMWPTVLTKAAATLAGFLVTVALLAGSTLPARASDRSIAKPFAWLAIVAMGIGLAGGVTHMRAQHPHDDELITLSLLELPVDDVSAQAQNALAYLMLITEGADIDTIDIAIRLAEAAVDGSQRKRAEILDTLAVGRFKQGDSEAAQDLLHEALRLTTGTDEPTANLRRFLEQRLRDVKAGGPLTPDPFQLR